MDDLQECGVKVEEVKTEYNACESPVLEQSDSEEIQPITTVYLFPMEEEQLEDPLAVDPLADCEEWNETKPQARSFLERVKKEEGAEPEEEADAGTSYERSDQGAFEEVEDGEEDASGSNRAESPSEKPEEEGNNQRKKGFKHSSDLTRHPRQHTGEQPYSCSICNKRFADENTLVSHVMFHFNIKPLVCKECGKMFLRKRDYTYHLHVHTGERPYKCSVCSKTFVQKGSLYSHMHTHTGLKQYKCSVCSKTFSQKGHLNNHMFTHTRDPKQMFECEVCGDSFKTTHMKRHMRTHTGERPYKCGYCDKTFAYFGNRKTHEVIHTREYPYNCAECGKGYCDKRKLVKHMQTHGRQKSNNKRKQRVQNSQR